MRQFLASALLAGAVAVAGPAFAQTKWDMPVPYGDNNFHTMNDVQFAKDIEKATDGKLTITIHSSGSLFKHPDIKNAVRQGLAQIGEILGSQLANEDPIFGLDSVPFIVANYDDARKLYDASKDEISKKLDAQGLKLLYSVPWPPQGIYTKGKIDSVDDLKGLKMRAYNTATERLAQLAGAVPTQVEVPDVPTAFATGRVDAMITSPSTGANTKVWDFLSNYNDVQAWIPRNMVFVNKAAFDALSDDQQKAVLDAAKTAEDRGWEASKKETEDKTKELKDNGITVSQPSDELKQGLRKIGKQMADEWAKQAGDEGKAVLDAYQSGK